MGSCSYKLQSENCFVLCGYWGYQGHMLLIRGHEDGKWLKTLCLFTFVNQKNTLSETTTVAAHVEHGANGSFGDDSTRRVYDKETRATMTFNGAGGPHGIYYRFRFFFIIYPFYNYRV